MSGTERRHDRTKLLGPMWTGEEKLQSKQNVKGIWKYDNVCAAYVGSCDGVVVIVILMLLLLLMIECL